MCMQKLNIIYRSLKQYSASGILIKTFWNLAYLLLERGTKIETIKI